MSDGPTYSPDQNSERQFVSLNKIVESGWETPRTVVYVPPIGGEFPPQDVLQQFAMKGNDVWAVSVPKYGQELTKYTEDLKSRSTIASLQDPYVVGFSSGCPLAAEYARAIGSPKDHVFLIAPAYPPGQMVKARAEVVIEKLRDVFRSEGRKHLPGINLGPDLNYAINNASLVRPGNIRNLIEMALVSREQLQRGLVVSGDRDLVSPQVRGTTYISVPNAGHKIEQLIPTVIERISAGPKSR